jgi:hypothetical protein
MPGKLSKSTLKQSRCLLSVFKEVFMPSKKNRRGPHSQKSAKRKKAKGRNRVRETRPRAQTNEPFEQDAKRRIGQHIGTGTAPLMKK